MQLKELTAFLKIHLRIKGFSGVWHTSHIIAVHVYSCNPDLNLHLSDYIYLIKVCAIQVNTLLKILASLKFI